MPVPYPNTAYARDLANGSVNFLWIAPSNDVYCVGGQGDVWHYDGQQWTRCPFPSNMHLWSVCCAGDGFVYIGAQSGNVFKGRKDTWDMIHEDQLALPFEYLAWFGDRVWGTNDYGLWWIVDDRVQRAEVPQSVMTCSGHLAVNDGVMLLAGRSGAALHDGTDWQPLFSLAELSVQASRR